MSQNYENNFKQRLSVEEVEEGLSLSPKFDENGLIPVITTDHKSGDILMHGYMNEEAIKMTIETREAHYWSRSRNEIWHKGETSGHTKILKDIRYDCDADVILLSIEQPGGIACHTGSRSCFESANKFGLFFVPNKLTMELSLTSMRLRKTLRSRFS